jgi:hypothetical protein
VEELLVSVSMSLYYNRVIGERRFNADTEYSGDIELRSTSLE